MWRALVLEHVRRLRGCVHCCVIREQVVGCGTVAWCIVHGSHLAVAARNSKPSLAELLLPVAHKRLRLGVLSGGLVHEQH